MRRGMVTGLLLGALAVGCSQAAAPAVVNEATPRPEATVDLTEPEPTVEVPTVAIPSKFSEPSKRTWAKIVKSPDRYTGQGFKLWACITQFDAATGEDSFRGDTSYKKLKYWYEGDNALFTGDANRLADFVQGDVVAMNVVGLGSYSYDTQIGGNTTAPLFQVVKITRKGSCD